MNETLTKVGSVSLFRCVGRWSSCVKMRLKCFQLYSFGLCLLLVVRILFSYIVTITAA